MNITWKKIWNLSVSRMAGFVLHPWKIRLLLIAPDFSTNGEALLKLYPGINVKEVEDCLAQLRTSTFLAKEVNARIIEKRHKETETGDWREFLYLLVRFAAPEVIVETGVFDGFSSAMILRALHDNGKGELISIDLPARWRSQKEAEHTLPIGCEPGWAIPDYLRGRFKLYQGDSKQLLPQVLRECGKIDMFFHDSLHTFEHMVFEYETAWRYLVEGGLLLSHDIFYSSAFNKFCREKGKDYIRCGVGVVKK